MPTYEQTLVTYLDILGFSDLIDQSDKNPEKIAEIINILFSMQNEASMGARYSSHSTKAQSFSDLVIRATHLNESSEVSVQIGVECLVLSGIQCKLLINDSTLIRGGVSLEKFYMDQGFVFGPGLVRSHHLAERLAIFPRIVIDPRIIALQRLNEKPNELPLHGTYIERGDDGQYFLDYLAIGHAFQINLFPKYTDKGTVLAKHKQRVEEKLIELKKGERERQKALWLAIYHNAVVRRLCRLNDSATMNSYMIPEQKLKDLAT
jgi:hypothetical protein